MASTENILGGPGKCRKCGKVLPNVSLHESLCGTECPDCFGGWCVDCRGNNAGMVKCERCGGSGYIPPPESFGSRAEKVDGVVAQEELRKEWDRDVSGNLLEKTQNAINNNTIPERAEKDALDQRYRIEDLEQSLNIAVADVARLTAENDKLRGLLGNSAKDCVYCGLPAVDQAKCERGFPGCARADDQMLSKHFADGWAAEQTAKENAMLRTLLHEAEGALERNVENSEELLAAHIRDLGETTDKNRNEAARLRADIAVARALLTKLRQHGKGEA